MRKLVGCLLLLTFLCWSRGGGFVAAQEEATWEELAPEEVLLTDTSEEVSQAPVEWHPEQTRGNAKARASEEALEAVSETFPARRPDEEGLVAESTEEEMSQEDAGEGIDPEGEDEVFKGKASLSEEAAGSEAEEPLTSLEDRSEESFAEDEAVLSTAQTASTAPQGQTGWVQRDGEWFYIKPDGSVFTNQVITFGEKTAYYIGERGQRLQGVFVDAQGKPRYAGDDGRLELQAKWVQIGADRYYSKGDFGKLFYNQRITFGTVLGFYMGSDGSVQYGHSVSPQNVHYFSDRETGQLKMSPGWIQDTDGAIYYGKGRGALFSGQVITFGPQVAYYMGGDASLQKGTVRTEDGSVLRLHEDTGQLIREAGWLDFDGERFYFRPDGFPFRNQIITFGMENAYLMGKTGAMQRGWQDANGERYYLSPDSGRAIRGWNRFAEVQFYFSPIRYHMVRGLQYTGERFHYFGQDGVLQVGKVQAEDTSARLLYTSLAASASERTTQGLGADYSTYVAYEDVTRRAQEGQRALLRHFASYPRSASIYYNEPNVGLEFTLNDKPQYPASTIKVLVMAAIYERIANGSLPHTPYIEHRIQQMITVSSNDACNELIKILGDGDFRLGCQRANEMAVRYHYTNTRVRHTVHPSRYGFLSNGEGSNQMTAEDAGRQMLDIYLGRLVNADYSRKMLYHLLGQKYRSKIPAGVGSGVRVANKTGYADQSDGYGYSSDMAIVYRAGRPYILSVFVYGRGMSNSTGARDIAGFSRVIYRNY